MVILLVAANDTKVRGGGCVPLHASCANRTSAAEPEWFQDDRIAHPAAGWCSRPDPMMRTFRQSPSPTSCSRSWQSNKSDSDLWVSCRGYDA
jgi:hypothetical protein